nr:hypothetical protein [Verrucomicrobiota bacterium]
NEVEFLERPALRCAVWIVIILLFAITNFPWHLDNYDQAKQAFTSFEMVNEGHWIYQHTPNEKIATKPPLVGWISATCYEITRTWEVAWRLPSLAAALAIAVVLLRAANVYGLAAGTIALGAFGLNLLSPRLATLVRTDMPLALVIFLLGWKILKKIRARGSWESHDRVIMFVLLTAAMLIKGPIVYAFLLPGVVAFQLWKREEAASAWCGWWPWIASLTIFGLWVAAGVQWVPGFYEQVVLKEFAGRFGETLHRPQPFYFYLPHLLQKFAPWSLLSLGLGVAAWRAREKCSPDIFWLVVWSLGGLVVMSLIPSKRVDRIFPIVPPLCLLIAAQFSAHPVPARRWSVIALLVALIFTGAYSAEKIFTAYRHDEGALARFGAQVRREAAAKNWRYEVLGGKDEGLLLYLRRTRFIRPNEALELWNSGKLEALVTPVNDAWQLPDANPRAEGFVNVNGEQRRYLFLSHRQ